MKIFRIKYENKLQNYFYENFLNFDTIIHFKYCIKLRSN